MSKILSSEVKTKEDLRKFLLQEIKTSPSLKNEPIEDARKVVDFTVGKMKDEDDVAGFMAGYLGKSYVIKPKKEGKE